MRTLITNIRTLAGVSDGKQQRLQGAAMSCLESVDNAWLLVEDGIIAAYGDMTSWAERGEHADVEVDAGEGMVLPSW